MRSKLFVPCARPEFFAKAMAGAADAISFDLEDSVPEDGKAVARGRLVEFLTSRAAQPDVAAKQVIVRVNALGSPYLAEDVAAAVAVGADLINIPKAEDAGDVRAAAEAVAAAGGLASTKLLVTIESARALARAAEIAGAHSSVAGLQVGLNDLFEPLGIDRRDLDHVRAALWTIRLACGEAGCFAYDGAFADITDDDGFRREAELARSLGYPGKSCVHPRQVAIANAVFARGPDELAMARRIVAAARDAAAEGKGAFLLDGRMIDLPAITRAEAVLADAEAGR